MSLNRRKNVFTLGDFRNQEAPPPNIKSKLKRRQKPDVFESDPFKIQSFNFRYADRPIFPLSDLQPKASNHSSATDCQTVFYNYDFPQNCNIQTSSINNNRALNLTKFQEYRRKKFLQNTSSGRNCNLYNSLNSSNNNYNVGTIKTMNNFNVLSRPQQSNAQDLKTNSCLLAKNNAKSKSSQSFIINTNDQTNQSQSSTSREISIKHPRSLSSGCEININIKSLENDATTDKVTIKIETDSICNNLDINKKSSWSPSSHSKLDRLKSSKTLARLSKYSLDQEKENILSLYRETPLEMKFTSASLQEQERKSLRDKQRERLKQLSLAYSPRLQKSKTKTVKSIDRFPSLIPFRGNSEIKNPTLTKTSFPLKKNDRLNYSSNIIKAPLRSSHYNELNICDETKILNSSLLTAKKSFLKKFNASRNSLASGYSKQPKASLLDSLPAVQQILNLKPIKNSKLPISVNINVYADKCKRLTN